MYSCLGIAGNKNLSDPIMTINYLPRYYLQYIPIQNTPLIPTFCNIARQIPFSISILVLRNDYIVVLLKLAVGGLDVGF